MQEREKSLIRLLFGHIHAILFRSVKYLLWEFVIVVACFSPALDVFFSLSSILLWYWANTYPNDNRGDFSCILTAWWCVCVCVCDRCWARIQPKCVLFGLYVFCVRARYIIFCVAFKPPNYVWPSMLSCCVAASSVVSRAVNICIALPRHRLSLTPSLISFSWTSTMVIMIGLASTRNFRKWSTNHRQQQQNVFEYSDYEWQINVLLSVRLVEWWQLGSSSSSHVCVCVWFTRGARRNSR